MQSPSFLSISKQPVAAWEWEAPKAGRFSLWNFPGACLKLPALSCHTALGWLYTELRPPCSCQGHSAAPRECRGGTELVLAWKVPVLSCSSQKQPRHSPGLLEHPQCFLLTKLSLGGELEPPTLEKLQSSSCPSSSTSVSSLNRNPQPKSSPVCTRGCSLWRQQEPLPKMSLPG